MLNGIPASLSGMSALGKKHQVAANNVANAHTDGFKKSRAELVEAPAPALGVEVRFRQSETPGPEVFEGASSLPHFSQSIFIVDNVSLPSFSAKTLKSDLVFSCLIFFVFFFWVSEYPHLGQLSEDASLLFSRTSHFGQNFMLDWMCVVPWEGGVVMFIVSSNSRRFHLKMIQKLTNFYPKKAWQWANDTTNDQICQSLI